MNRSVVTLTAAICMLIVVLVSGVVSSPSGRVPTLLSASGTVDGVRLTLTIPDRVYPRNALIDASVRVHNGAGREVSARGTSCTQTNPSVVDRGGSGRVLYPGGIRWFNLLPFCGATTEDTYMAAGYDTIYHVLAIARGPVLRATMWFRPTNAVAQVIVRTPAIAIRLGPAKPPVVRVLRQRGRLLLRIRPRGQVHGSLEYVSLAHCYRGSDTWDYLGYFWSGTMSRTVLANCPNPSSWRVIAGWVGGSVAFVSYKKDVRLPVY